jgi:8-hydroxy-5-deazaflavin:NADPH oxidoreductase
MSERLSVGIIGAGKVGTAIGRLALAADHRVLFLGSPRSDNVQLLLDFTVPSARAVTSAGELAEAADIIVLAVPFNRSSELDYDHFDGRIVVDAMNYWAAIDGEDPVAEDAEDGTSALVALRNPRARWVKSLNHLGYHDMEAVLEFADEPESRAIGVASDDVEAKRFVARLVASLGLDPVDSGTLADGRRLQTGSPVFGRELTRDQFEAMLESDELLAG